MWFVISPQTSNYLDWKKPRKSPNSIETYLDHVSTWNWKNISIKDLDLFKLGISIIFLLTDLDFIWSEKRKGYFDFIWTSWNHQNTWIMIPDFRRNHTFQCDWSWLERPKMILLGSRNRNRNIIGCFMIPPSINMVETNTQRGRLDFIKFDRV